MMTDRDRSVDELSPGWISGAVVPPTVPVLGEVTAAALAATPDAEALVVHRTDGESVRLTHRELEDDVARRAAALRAAGVGPGDCVVVVASRVPGLVPALLALLRLGAAYVPVDPAAPDARWRTVADAVGARLLLGPASSLPRAAAALAEGTRLLDLDAPLSDDRVCAGDVTVDPAAPAYVLFTSGSTGTPKGVLVSHGNVVHRIESYLALTDGPCRYLLHSSLTFDGAVGGMFSTLARGGSLVLVPDAVAGDPALVAGVVREERVTHLEPVPSWYTALLELAGPGDLDSVRVVILGGEVLPPDLVAASRRALPRARLFNDYGPTEVTVAATVFEVGAGWAGGDVPIGRPHANTTVALLDEDLRPVPAGAVGELWVGGPGVALGYLGLPDHPAFRPDPATGGRCYRTGDLARWGEDGLLHFAGRRDRQVKIRGQRIEPEEVEAVLQGLPGVATAAVEVDTAGPEPRLVAYAAPLPRAELAPESVQRLLAERLPSHLRPGAVVVLAALPLTPGGKVDRRALPAAPRAASTGQAPRGPLEQEVADAFAAVLGAPVDRDTDFFAAGGQSLGAARVVARLRGSTGVEVGLADLTTWRTPAQVAAALAVRPPAEAEPPLRRRSRPAGEVWRVPAAPRQESFWFLESVPGGAGRSNLVEVLTLPPGTSEELLQRAVEVLVQRHAALRTGFELTPDGLVQVVVPRADVRLVPLPAAATAADLDDLADDFGLQTFDLTRAPLLRAGVSAGPDGPALVLVVHHAVADGWSLGLLVEEVATVVRAGGDPAGLPEPAVEYVDLTEWVADRPAARREAAVDHLVPLLRRSAATGREMVPFDRPRPARPDPRGGLVTGAVPAATFERVVALARTLGTTAYAVLGASLGALLARSSGQSGVVLSGPLSGRGEPALDRVVGCCINTQLFPVEISGEPSFAGLVSRVAADAAAGEPHGWLPLEVALRPLEEGVRADVAPVLFNLLEHQPADLTVPAGQLQRRSRPSVMAYSELDLYLEHRDGGLRLEVVHNLARLDRSTVEQLVERWLHLLGAALDDPDRPVSGLPLLTPAEQARLDRLEGDPGELPLGTVLDAVRARLAEDPAAVAVVDGSGPWTRAELWGRAGAIAAHLGDQGVAAGDTVVLALDETADAVAALLGCWRAGAVAVPVGESQPEARVAAVAASAGAALVLDRGELDDVPDTGDWTDVPRPASAAAYVLYTSGSTGEPKGVVVAHAALTASTLARFAAYPDRPEVALVAHDLAFDAGLGIVSWYLWTGGRLVMVREDERLDPALLGGLVQRHRAGQLDIVPSHYRLLLDLAPPGQLESLRLVTLGGEACPPALVEEHLATVPGAALVNEYGPTESTVWALAHTCTPADAVGGRVPIGRPIRGVVARVADATGHRVPPGVIGELFLGGHLLADGYLGDPARTADRFVEHDARRWYRTGDRVRWTAHDEVEFLGRVDTQLKVRGYRIEREEVETALTGLEGVARAVVDAVELVAGAPVLVGWVQLTPEAAADGRYTPDRLRDQLLVVLPEWLVPNVLLLVDEIPETTAGKADRARLPRPVDDGLQGGAPPETATEAAIAAVWADLLGRPVGVDQSFFALGGQSLLVARMVARVRVELDAELELRDVLTAPRVRDLAELVDAGRAPVVPLPRDPAARAEPVDATPAGLLDVADVEDLMAQMDELSDDEVEALLSRLGEQ